MVIVVHRFTAFSSFFPAGCEKWQPDFFEGTVMSDLVHVKKGYAPKLRSGFIKYDIYESFGEIFVAMVYNYQKGTHSTEAVPLASIAKCFNGVVTSRLLYNVFVCKSNNNGSFLIAILLKEKLIERCGRHKYRSTNSLDTWQSALKN